MQFEAAMSDVRGFGSELSDSDTDILSDSERLPFASAPFVSDNGSHTLKDLQPHAFIDTPQNTL